MKQLYKDSSVIKKTGSSLHNCTDVVKHGWRVSFKNSWSEAVLFNFKNDLAIKDDQTI